ncbi:hypothetical protein Ntsu_54370 [Nocardia sp. IFM 10818]
MICATPASVSCENSELGGIGSSLLEGVEHAVAVRKSIAAAAIERVRVAEKVMGGIPNAN